MELLRYTDYTLRVLIYLAARSDRRATIADIAADFQVSHNHLTKIVHRLAGGGYLSTSRGKGGGMVLAREPEAISVGEVVRFAEGTLDMVECLQPRCPIVGGCRLREVFGEARDAFLATLDRYSVGDLVGDGSSIAAMLAGRGFAMPATGGRPCALRPRGLGDISEPS